jgi:dTDP-4-dehydrorhamnose reductase
MNRIFARLLAEPLAGIYHAGGPRQLSLYEIAQIVNVVGGYDPELLKGCQRIEAGPMPPRAGNVTLDSSKLLSALGYEPFDPWPYHDDLVPNDLQWHRSGDRMLGSAEHVHRLLYQNPNGPGKVPPSRTELWGADRFG